MKYTDRVPKWGVFEFSADGRTAGNPFVDYNIRAHFHSSSESKTVNGFYDGSGTYTVRFMPSFEEKYEFEVSGTFSEKIYSGEFTACAPEKRNHGPVSPTALREYNKGDYSNQNPYGWSKSSINNLLHNEVYLGKIVYGKKRKVNFKSKKVIKVDESE